MEDLQNGARSLDAGNECSAELEAAISDAGFEIEDARFFGSSLPSRFVVARAR